ncbi:MAG: MBL fold metallo-hydrolase [Acidobacteria bacterium]|nr:MBL fold metallo-hydrolase [Acidobacteriota bacterium]MCA1632852.1 MBL fold metallo-hydrolase [Acidobacteriota bacterium]MCA1640988.1 MBL fold metallo-hydrolase [Acidobacteriota bacterium]
MRIIPVSLPTPFYIGPVNVYLIAEDPVTLIDTGPKTKEAREALREGLRRARLRVSDIRRIVLTHAHEDHCGLAKQVRDEAKDAEVFVHGWETGHRAGRLAYEEHRALLVRAGVPSEEIDEMRKLYEHVREFADALADDEHSELKDDAELEFATGALRVVHTPGHTPGSCSFVREADRTVIAGDCVLKRVTPNPVLSPDPVDPTRRFRSLAEYLVSLARLRTFSPTLVHGGHGDAVDDYEELFNRYLRAIRERQTAVVSLVPKAGATAWDVSRELFPGADDVHRFLAVSEAVAHLDLAQSEGKLAVELSDGREVYRKLTGAGMNARA